jgi:hypothetical protein
LTLKRSMFGRADIQLLRADDAAGRNRLSSNPRMTQLSAKVHESPKHGR